MDKYRQLALDLFITATVTVALFVIVLKTLTLVVKL